MVKNCPSFKEPESWVPCSQDQPLVTTLSQTYPVHTIIFQCPFQYSNIRSSKILINILFLKSFQIIPSSTRAPVTVHSMLDFCAERLPSFRLSKLDNHPLSAVNIFTATLHILRLFAHLKWRTSCYSGHTAVQVQLLRYGSDTDASCTLKEDENCSQIKTWIIYSTQ